MIDTSDITAEILSRLAKLKPTLTHFPGNLPDFPNSWDINCGWCEEWAIMAEAKYGGEMIWLDQIDESYFDFGHAVLKLNERFYDSQHPNGVASPNDLDLVKGIGREEFLQRKLQFDKNP
jgi:hypothetical protein